MKISTVILLLAPLALSSPSILRRQGRGKLGGGGSGQVCFVWARGSLEPSPMGYQPGPQLQSALRLRFPGLKTYPVMYAASIATNISPERTDSASIAKGVLAFKEAAGCPVIVAGGYSQGAAVMHNVVKDLDQNIKAKIAGVALFGDTRNQQDGGHIKNFPPERSKVWCNATDGVCGGSLAVGITHLAYASEAGAAANWLAGRVNSMKSGGGGSSEGMGLGRGGKGGKGGRGGKGGKGKGGGGKGGKGLAGKGSKDEKPKEDETPKADEKPKVDETPKVNETPKVDEE